MEITFEVLDGTGLAATHSGSPDIPIELHSANTRSDKTLFLIKSPAALFLHILQFNL